MNFFHQKRTIPLFAIAIVLLSANLKAQVVRPYSLVYSDNVKGGHTMFGNTILARDAAAMNTFSLGANGVTSTFGNDNANMTDVDVDGGATVSTLVAFGSTWNYHNANSEPASWPNVNSLSDGPTAAPLSYGYTSSTLTDRRTYYFIKSVNIANPASYSGFTFNLNYDDGAVVYVNGTEVGRINMGAGDPGYTTNASGCEENATDGFTVGSGAPFVAGTNYIQVEVHTCADNESGTDDLLFDLEMTGTTINATFNSSSADLVLPGGSNTIKFARLYWGGRIDDDDARYANRASAKIRKGAGAYQNVTAPGAQIDQTLITGDQYAYQAYIDITAFVNSNGAGTYTVADVAATTGSVGGGGNYGGWAIVVVYENPALSFSSVRVYDGFLQVFNGGSPTTQSIVLTGLNAPATPVLSSDAYMSTMAWEGDANLAASAGNPAGDYVEVNGFVVSNAVNPATNFWNGTISKNGVHITTKSPHYLNQMGIDIDEQEVGTGYGIVSNATSVNVEFGTEADQYFPSLFAFTMKTKDPLVTLDKTATTSITPFLLLNPNEIITYTISGVNSGSGNALQCMIVDSLPSSITYVANSLVINTSPGGFTGAKSDAADADQAMKGIFAGRHYVKYYIGTGATGVAGGTLAPGETYSVEFKCLTPANANALNSVANTARITGISVGGDPFVDDGTVIIGPPGSPLAVKLTAFTVVKAGDNALLKWSTAGEEKNDRYEIERSYDGLNFGIMGTVAGSGTTSEVKNYQYADPITSAAKIIYYRLRIIDQDGKISYSKIIALRMDGLTNLNNFSVYPNPFESDIKLQMSSVREAQVTIRISTVSGQQVAVRTVTVQPGDNIIVIKDLDHLKTGVHMLEIISEEGKVSQKIMKK